MKKLVWFLVLMLALTGCGGAEEEAVFESVGEAAYEPVSAPDPSPIYINIPEEAAAQTMAEEDGTQVYTWQDYELRIETRPGGDIQATLEALTGRGSDGLTVMQYQKDTLQIYETVWSAVGEEGITLGRAMVADDGYYHYCVSLLSPEESDAADVYAELCASFSLSEADASK